MEKLRRSKTFVGKSLGVARWGEALGVNLVLINFSTQTFWEISRAWQVGGAHALVRKREIGICVCMWVVCWCYLQKSSDGSWGVSIAKAESLAPQKTKHWDEQKKRCRQRGRTDINILLLSLVAWESKQRGKAGKRLKKKDLLTRISTSFQHAGIES